MCAQRRMFSLKVVDTDAFLDMPMSSQLLYFHLAMRADDDGFVANPKKITRMLGVGDDDYKVLTAKKFIIPFESGVCVIKHWLIHNLIRGDRYSETSYVREKEQLKVDEKTKKYSLNKGEDVNVIPNGNQMATQVRLGKVRLNINNSDKSPISKKELLKGMGMSEKIVNTQQWQQEALDLIEAMNVPEERKSSVFKCFKDNPRNAKFALNDCRELDKMNINYFFKIYNELNKK